MKKIILLTLIGAVFYPTVIAAFEYPVIGGIDINNPSITASQFILYLFYILTALGALLGAILLIVAGLEWASAYGDAGVVNSAKKKIVAVFSGLLILFTSYIIINTINPDILILQIDDVSKGITPTEIIIPEGKGVLLYSEVNYGTDKDSPLNIVKSIMANLMDVNFNRKTSSIKINQPDDKTLGLILFADRINKGGEVVPGVELRGQCSYIMESIPDLDSSLGDQNKPSIGQDTLASLILFSGNPGGIITIYNNYNCQPKVDKYCRKDEKIPGWKEPYPCLEPEEYSCTFAVNEFRSIKNILNSDCKSGSKGFKGDILSIGFDVRTGILLRGLLIDGDKDKPEKTCQYFDSKNTNCINMIKYGPFYRIIDGERESIFSPEEIMVFSLD